MMATTSAAAAAIVPVPRFAVSVRPATAGDLPFIDALQRKQTKHVGFMPRAQLEGKVAAGQVLVAEEVGDQRSEVRSQKSEVSRGESDF